MEVVFGSPIDYNEGVVYLYFDSKPLCLINKEKGLNNLEVEFFKENEILISFSDLEMLLSMGVEEIKKESPNM